jgi:ParB family transcriptional regulator, chromosome partitioning protein
MSKKDTPYAAMKKPVSMLFGGQPSAMVQAHPSEAIAPTDSQPSNQIALAQIKLPLSQPRRYFDSLKLEELSRSIKELGILEPLLIRPLAGGDYELVAGERRYKAAQLAGLTEVPVIIRSMDDITASKVQIVENLQREDLNPLEETEGILDLLALQLEWQRNEVTSHLNKMRNVCDRYSEDSEVRHNIVSQRETIIIEELFSSLGRMGWQSFVKHRLPLLNLPVDVMEALRQGKIEYTKARAVARVKDEDQRQELLKSAISENLSLTQINERIQATKQIVPVSNSLKERYKQAMPKLQKSHVWDNPKKQKALEKLLTQIEALIEE